MLLARENSTHRLRLWNRRRYMDRGSLQQPLQRVLSVTGILEDFPQIHDLCVRDGVADGRMFQRRLGARLRATLGARLPMPISLRTVCVVFRVGCPVQYSQPFHNGRGHCK